MVTVLGMCNFVLQGKRQMARNCNEIGRKIRHKSKKQAGF
jgi:hypothetical protein